MLEKEIFKTVVKNTPLVSIDLCIEEKKYICDLVGNK